jgi:HEAT repeat protein
MSFYDLSKEERHELVSKMEKSIKNDLKTSETKIILKYASDDDFYIRKNTYLILGRLYNDHDDLREKIMEVTESLLKNEDEKVRQTAIYAFSEIGKIDADKVWKYFEIAINDEHHVVKNAVMGALKQIGEKNPEPTLKFARKFLCDDNPEIRRIIVHGIELRGRKHPEDILPLLEELQNEENKRVRDMVIHVIGQISYKKGCLETTISTLKTWENKKMVKDAVTEIINVHKRYKFADKSPEEAEEYIESQLHLN